MAVLLAGCETSETEEPGFAKPEKTEFGTEFLDALREFCGQVFTGNTIYPDDREHRLYKARLRMEIETCDDNQIHIPFYINDYPPRIWIITLEEDGRLSLRHYHTDSDETPEDVNMYGGYAKENGTETMQRFASDIETTAMMPEAAANEWTMKIDHEAGIFTYELTRGNQPRFKGEFTLSSE